MLSDEELSFYEKSGRIASEVREEIKKQVSKGASILHICENVENLIKKNGGEPAFPCNVCINQIAAHYTSPPDDILKIPENAIVKIDLGVHIEGYIADTAITICLNPDLENMIFTANNALEKAIKLIRPGISTSDIGSTIEETIRSYGFKPIWNLSGHQMNRYNLHAGKSIPNVQRLGFGRINEGEVYAIEPFLTVKSGAGEVKNIKDINIFRLQFKKNSKNKEHNKILDFIANKFKNLPFSKRWLIGFFSEEFIDKVFKELIYEKKIITYPVLVERNETIVVQSEHTIIVTKDGCIVTTN